MADFSSLYQYQDHHSFPLDPSLFLKLEELTNASSSNLPSFLFNSSTHEEAMHETSRETQMDCSSSIDLDPHAHGFVAKKRKSRESSASLSSAQSKDSKQGKNRRVKKQTGGKKAAVEDSTKTNGEEKSEEEEPPKGYIHVRARRGQATDSHSLAERVRRERISERMRMLQALVPGCDKVTGKALILDEIINYVQSLHNQVEFLSMRIASMSPVLYGFGNLESDGLNEQPEQQKIGNIHQETLPMPSLLSQSTPTQAIMDNSTSYSLQGQEAISFSQDNCNFLMQTVGGQRQELLNQVVFSNMCSYQ